MNGDGRATPSRLRELEAQLAAVAVQQQHGVGVGAKVNASGSGLLLEGSHQQANDGITSSAIGSPSRAQGQARPVNSNCSSKEVVFKLHTSRCRGLAPQAAAERAREAKVRALSMEIDRQIEAEAEEAEHMQRSEKARDVDGEAECVNVAQPQCAEGETASLNLNLDRNPEKYQ